MKLVLFINYKYKYVIRMSSFRNANQKLELSEDEVNHLLIHIFRILP